MCTAITFQTADHYFGRTLDLEHSYSEAITVTPRNFPFRFRRTGALANHFAIIGMAAVEDGFPLYYDAANEHGLSMAGLNFPGSAFYFPETEGKDNVAPFEFIPWILAQCRDLAEARARLENLSLCALPFSDRLPLSPLHWIIADRSGAITVESVQDGLKIYENPVGVLTNNPPFDYQMTHLCDYMNITARPPENRFGGRLVPYSRGMGGIGLPGDLSSASRFVRAAFMKLASVSGPGEEESVGQFFHILGAVEHPRGCVRLPDGSCQITQYTSCINTDRGIYYCTTYENRCICAVDLHRCDPDGRSLSVYPPVREQKIQYLN